MKGDRANRDKNQSQNDSFSLATKRETWIILQARSEPNQKRRSERDASKRVRDPPVSPEGPVVGPRSTTKHLHERPSERRDGWADAGSDRNVDGCLPKRSKPW